MGLFSGDRRQREQKIEDYEFPKALVAAGRKAYGKDGWALIERGLLDWFICLANAKRKSIAPPSHAVEWAWEEFAGMPEYRRFCRSELGRSVAYREPTPEEDWPRHIRCVQAWDRSVSAEVREEDTVLWSLDDQLGLERPIGLGPDALEAIRRDYDRKYGGAWAWAGGGGY